MRRDSRELKIENQSNKILLYTAIKTEEITEATEGK